MCLAAKTPSTIAQQKAATTPKLMKTMEATNWKERGGVGWGGGRERSVSFIALHHPDMFVSQQSKHGAFWFFPSAAGVVCIMASVQGGTAGEHAGSQPSLLSSLNFTHSPFFYFFKLSFIGIFGCAGPHPVCRVAGEDSRTGFQVDLVFYAATFTSN